MSLEIRNKTFQKVFRGYSPDEVSEYLDYVEEEYEKIEKRAETAEKRLVYALKKLDEATKRLDEIADAEKMREAEADDILAEADYTAKRITAEAKLKAAKIIKQATDTAENIMKQAEIDLAEATAREEAIVRSTRKIYSEIDSFRDSLFDLYKVHIEAVEMLSGEAKEFIRAVDDSVYVDEDDFSEIAAAPVSDTEPSDIVEESPVILEAEEEEVRDEAQDSFIKLDFEGEEDLVQAEPIQYEQTSEDFVPEDDVLFIGEGFETVDGEDFYAEEAQYEAAPEAVEEISELDDFFTDAGDMSLTDEFDMIFSSSNSGRNVDEIRRQPTVSADEVPKHGWFDKRKK